MKLSLFYWINLVRWNTCFTILLIARLVIRIHVVERNRIIGILKWSQVASSILAQISMQK